MGICPLTVRDRKKSYPCKNVCWDRIVKYISCGATRLDAPFDAPTLRIPSYAGLCLRRATSVSHTPAQAVSARPQKPIPRRALRRNSTACGSLSKRLSVRTYASSTVYRDYSTRFFACQYFFLHFLQPDLRKFWRCGGWIGPDARRPGRAGARREERLICTGLKLYRAMLE